MRIWIRRIGKKYWVASFPDQLGPYVPDQTNPCSDAYAFPDEWGAPLAYRSVLPMLLLLGVSDADARVFRRAALHTYVASALLSSSGHCAVLYDLIDITRSDIRRVRRVRRCLCIS